MSLRRASTMPGDDGTFDEKFCGRVAVFGQIADGIQKINLLALIKNPHETYNPCGVHILRMEKSL